MALTEKLTAIADAIREKTGKTAALTLGEMPVEIAGIQPGGGANASNEDAILEGNITEYSNDRISVVGFGRFYGAERLESVSLPNVTELLTGHHFSGCTSLKKVHLPSCVALGQAQGYSFNNCTALEEIEMPSVTSCGSYTFQNCKSLVRAYFPALARTAYGMFRYDTSLRVAVFGGISRSDKMASLCFYACAVFDTLVIKNTSVVVLENVNTFQETPFASGGTGGTVYVPQALIEQYQNATNWSTLYAAGTCNFVAIEGSEYE